MRIYVCFVRRNIFGWRGVIFSSLFTSWRVVWFLLRVSCRRTRVIFIGMVSLSVSFVARFRCWLARVLLLRCCAVSVVSR